MDVRIEKPIRGGTVRAISSKSEAHRLLICAALAEGATFVACPQRSEDIDATAACLEALGAKVRYEGEGFYVEPVGGVVDGAAHLHCGESGSTLRFLLPVCGALGVTAALHMDGRLPERPLSPLYEEMASHGCILSEPGRSPLICEGQLQSGTYTLAGNISSQFISGLMFALPLLAGDSKICVTGALESRPYVDMTLEALGLFGVNISEEVGGGDAERVFRIKGGQRPRSPGTVRAGGDWSNAAFWLSAGALTPQGVTVTGLDLKSKQGDRAIVDLLPLFGAEITCEGDAVTVMGGSTSSIGDALPQPIEINAEDTPDLVPILAAVASVTPGKTVIRGAGRLRIKESDRLRTVAATLSALGADIAETEDGLVIVGKENLSGGEAQSFGDHRIAMTAAILSCACTGLVVIRGAGAVRKSYPTFFMDFADVLGGECDVL
ncbi:MAG: 3-phosphoshikimate 1-carboxyvinyltransferase [Clostridiales bacterium]|nr:3-phosphoshikimate 1-carboxyvinyltransferase [Clostridiales bacterium]